MGLGGQWERTPETVTASSQYKAAWRCGLCGHSWSAEVSSRTHNGAGCPPCGREARRKKTRRPSISDGAPYLLAKWDWEANDECGLHPEQITLSSAKQVHWVVQDEQKVFKVVNNVRRQRTSKLSKLDTDLSLWSDQV